MTMTTKDTVTGHAAAFAAYAIFGFNIIVCKDLTGGDMIPPLGIFTLRSVVAGALFWIASLFVPKETIDRKDYIRILKSCWTAGFPLLVAVICGCLNELINVARNLQISDSGTQYQIIISKTSVRSTLLI